MKPEPSSGTTDTKGEVIYLTQYQLHKEYGVGKATISRAVKAGRLQLHTRADGRKLVFLREALQVFADHIKGNAELSETTSQSTETAETGTTQKAIMELMELKMELALAKQELTHKDEIIQRIEDHKADIARERDRLKSENETLKMLPPPANNNHAVVEAEHKPTFWQRLTGAKS